jgi:hypothetical protein
LITKIKYCLSVSSSPLSGYKFDSLFCFFFPVSCLAVSGSLEAYISCHFASSCDAVPGSYIVYFFCCFASSLAFRKFLCFCNRRISYCQPCSMMQSSLLWFLRSFLGIFCFWCYHLSLIAYNEDMTVWKSVCERDVIRIRVAKNRLLRTVS